MDDKDKISIIIPAYNSEKYIAEAIESVVNQTYDNWELLVIDDGSTDETGQIVNEYEKNESSIKAVHTENMGVSHARNIGLDMTRGKWIYLLDIWNRFDYKCILYWKNGT